MGNQETTNRSSFVLGTEATAKYSKLIKKSPQNFKRPLRIGFVGFSNSGKTALITRIARDSFDKTKKTHDAIDYQSVCLWIGQLRIRLLLVDTANQDNRFGPIVNGEIHKCDGVVLVCDVTNPLSTSLLEYFAKIVEGTKAHENKNVLIAANKSDKLTDLNCWHMPAAEACAKKWSFVCTRCSAKTGIGVGDMVGKLVCSALTEQAEFTTGDAPIVLNSYEMEMDVDDLIVQEYVSCNPCQC